MSILRIGFAEARGGGTLDAAHSAPCEPRATRYGAQESVTEIEVTRPARIWSQ